MLPPEPDLDFVTASPESAPRASLLFVHGGYTNLWCWQPYFLPYFARRGFVARALSLRGHGKSGGAESLFLASLDDYAQDVADVASTLPEPPVLVGHSMGAAVVERALERIAAPAMVLLAPIPPDGLLITLRDLLASRPDLMIDFQQLEAGRPTPAALEALQPLYFNRDAGPELHWQMIRNMQAESERALLDLTFRWQEQPRRSDTPTLVIAPGADKLFPPARVHETARRYGSRARVLAGLPHMLMLDDGWQVAADTIVDWLERTLEV